MPKKLSPPPEFAPLQLEGRLHPEWARYFQLLATSGVNADGALGAMDLTDGQVIVGQSGADPLAKTLSGGLTLSAAGVVGGEALIKGWINFDGTGTIAVKDGYNVTALTDNGTGDYTVIWDTDFADAAYAVAGLAGLTANFEYFIGVMAKAAGTIRVGTYLHDGTATDVAFVSIIAIGAQ